jgi:putative DNA primase/helicase
MNAIDQFRLALATRQLIPPTEIIADGKIHRCNVEGKNGRNDGSYLLHLDGFPAGGFQNHKDGRGWENWHADPGRKLSVTENEVLRAKIAAQQTQRDEQYANECADVKARATKIWESSSDVGGDHKYLESKQVMAHGARVYQGERIDGTSCDGALVVPIQDAAGDVCQLQLIFPDGKKRFLRGPKPAGLFYVVGDPGDVVCIAEGFATAASISEATGHAVAVAFDCVGLLPVAEAIRRALPETKIVICADDDYKTVGNPGVTNANAAAMATRSFVAIPNFGADRPEGCTDFNDLARLHGAEAVGACVESAHQPEAVPSPPTSPESTLVTEPTVGLVCADSIKPEPVDWLWPGYLAAGKLHILAGEPGTGKTTVALSIAAAISSGGMLADDSHARIGQVLIWSGEDDPADTLIPRLTAMGADLKNIHLIKSAGVGKKVRAFDPARDMAELSATIQQRGLQPALLILDPVVSAVAGDSHKNSETRRALQPLVDLGVAESCAVLGISHLSKGSAGRPITERVIGSQAFVAVARVLFIAGRLREEDGGDRFVVRAKSNVGADGNGFKYRLDQRALPDNPHISASVVVWGDVMEGSAREILARAEGGEPPASRTKTDEAEEWLREVLKNGPIKAAEATTRAAADGITPKALRRARERLQIKLTKNGFGGSSIWSLPDAKDAPPGTDDHSNGVGIFDAGGHLRATELNGIPDNTEAF